LHQFLPDMQRDVRSDVVLMEDQTPFRFANSGRFSSIAAFSQSNWEQYLSEFIIFGCVEGVRNT